MPVSPLSVCVSVPVCLCVLVCVCAVRRSECDAAENVNTAPPCPREKLPLPTKPCEPPRTAPEHLEVPEIRAKVWHVCEPSGTPRCEFMPVILPLLSFFSLFDARCRNVIWLATAPRPSLGLKCPLVAINLQYSVSVQFQQPCRRVAVHGFASVARPLSTVGCRVYAVATAETARQVRFRDEPAAGSRALKLSVAAASRQASLGPRFELMWRTAKSEFSPAPEARPLGGFEIEAELRKNT